MPGALLYHLNVYRLARSIATLEERIQVMVEILERIPIETARTRHGLLKERIEILEDSLNILRQRYSNELRRIR